MYKRILLIITLILMIASSLAMAQHDTTFFKRHQAGLRFGGWASRGEIPPALVESGTGDSYQSDVGSSSFYMEFSGAMRIFHRGYLELSLGFANRGEVSRSIGGIKDLGNLLIVPVLIQLKYYLPSPSTSILPYIQAGGGLYSGRQSIQFSNNFGFPVNRESETEFNYVLGGGFDWPLSSSIALEANARYMPITFSDNLVFIKDYSATTITMGVRYMFISKKAEPIEKKKR